jgi:hypothetical protein
VKKRVYLIIVIFLMISGIAFTTSVFGYSNGAPAGYTGSPGDGHICTSCHGGTATAISGYFTTDIPANGYIAGTTYTITVSFTGTGGKGFEVSPQNAAGTQLGTLIAGSGSKLVGGSKYCTQTTHITTTTATWVFQWTAPVAGTGDVTFYGAFVITQATCHKESITVPEFQALSVVASATPSSLCKGSSTQLNAIASGGSGTYSYSWSSLPPGFTSTIQNPMATPLVNTKYFVLVNDGTNSVNDSVSVSVQSPPTSFAGNDTTVCVQTTQISLRGTTSNSSSILWTTSGDGTFSNATSLQSVYDPGAGDKSSLHVNLTLISNAMSPCTNAASNIRHITFDPCSGVSVLNGEELSFSFWPNPTTGRLTLLVNRPSATEVTLDILDLTGTSRHKEKFGSTDLSMTLSLDLGNLPSGIYFMKLESGNAVTVKKLVIL